MQADTCLGLFHACENLITLVYDRKLTELEVSLDAQLQTIVAQFKQDLCCRRVIQQTFMALFSRAASSAEWCSTAGELGTVSQTEFTALLAAWALSPFVQHTAVDRAVTLAIEVFDLPLLAS